MASLRKRPGTTDKIYTNGPRPVQKGTGMTPQQVAGTAPKPAKPTLPTRPQITTPVVSRPVLPTAAGARSGVGRLIKAKRRIPKL